MTNERTWTFQDKNEWGEGEWLLEPDKIQLVDPDTGYPCLVVRNQLGFLCGYVGVTEGHPLFDYFGSHWEDAGHPENVLEVHGGISFFAFCQEDNTERGICHIPEPGKPDKVFWFGFDCAHAWDIVPGMRVNISWGEAKVTYKNVAYVKEQIKSLAAQLYALK